MNERQLTEQLLLTHPYFRQDDYGDRLSDEEKADRIGELQDGFLINLKREKDTTIQEIHKAVGIIVESPDSFSRYSDNPLTLLKMRFVWDIEGKCALSSRSKKQRKDDEEDGNTAHMPKHIKKKFDRLLNEKRTPEQEAFRRQYFIDRPDTQYVCLMQDGSLSGAYRPGRRELP
jgi:hypothetical protein